MEISPEKCFILKVFWYWFRVALHSISRGDEGKNKNPLEFSSWKRVALAGVLQWHDGVAPGPAPSTEVRDFMAIQRMARCVPNPDPDSASRERRRRMRGGPIRPATQPKTDSRALYVPGLAAGRARPAVVQLVPVGPAVAGWVFMVRSFQEIWLEKAHPAKRVPADRVHQHHLFERAQSIFSLDFSHETILGAHPKRNTFVDTFASVASVKNCKRHASIPLDICQYPTNPLFQGFF